MGEYRRARTDPLRIPVLQNLSRRQESAEKASKERPLNRKRRQGAGVLRAQAAECGEGWSLCWGLRDTEKGTLESVP